MNPIVNSNEPGDSQKILDLINSGLIQTDAEGMVLLWNNWVASHSGIPAEIALGHPLETLLGDELSPTFKAAFHNALTYKFPVILSNALHRSPLPLYPLPLTRQRSERIQQSITITPIITNNKPFYLIQIVDASVWVKRESVLKLQSEQQKRISQQLQESGDRLQVLFEQAAVGVAEIDTMTGRFLKINRKYGEVLGYSVEEMLALDFMTITHPDDLAPDLAQMEHLRQGDIHEFTLEKRLLHRDGSIIWVDLTVSPLWARGETPTRHIAVVKDITERKQMEETLRQSEERFRLIVEEVRDHAIVMLDQQGLVLTWNVGAQRLKGYTAAEIIGQPMERFYPAEDIAAGKPAHLLALAVAKGSCEDEGWRVRQDGTRFYADMVLTAVRDTAGELIGFAKVTRDITDRKQAEQRILEMATHDVLTGLPNRRLLQDRIAQSLVHNHRSQKQAAVLFIDLDHFKIINDTLGHDMGDLLLKEVAERLISSVRSEDTVARQGGDEFIVLLTTITGFQDAEVVAQKILNALIQPFQINDNELHIGGSIGIALFPSDGEDVDTLLKNSDAAMYHAKQNGRNNYRFFAQLRDLADEK